MRMTETAKIIKKTFLEISSFDLVDKVMRLIVYLIIIFLLLKIFKIL